MKILALVATFSALVLVAGASAANAPGYLTTAQANQVLLAPATSTIWFSSGPGANRLKMDWSGQRAVIKAACRGMGVARQGRFSAFFCSVEFTYRHSSDAAFTENDYVRVWSMSKVCASSRALADCPPPLVGAPLPGDPRCGTQSAKCMGEVAGSKTLDALRAGQFLPVVNAGCLPVTAFVYGCTWSPPGHADWPRGATVRFVKGKTSWTTTVALTR